MEQTGTATAAAPPPPLPPKTRRVLAVPAASAAATVLASAAPVPAPQPLQQPGSGSAAGEHVVKIRINPDGGSPGSIRISVGGQHEDMVRRPADAYLKPRDLTNPYFFCSAFPASAMVISSGQSSPSDTLDSGTCSDLDGSTPPPLPKKNGVSAAPASATVTVTVFGNHAQHRRTGSLTSSGADADSDEDAASNISCDSLNGHDLADDPNYARGLSNGYHKHGEGLMESIQEEKAVAPLTASLKSATLAARTDKLVNSHLTAQVAPLLAATAAAIDASHSGVKVSGVTAKETATATATSHVTFHDANGYMKNAVDTCNSGVKISSLSLKETASASATNASRSSFHDSNGYMKTSPKTAAKPIKATPTVVTVNTSPTSPPKTFLPQGLLKDIRDRSATLNDVSANAPANTNTSGNSERKLRTWGELSQNADVVDSKPQSIYCIVGQKSTPNESPQKPTHAGGIVQERTYEERNRERNTESRSAKTNANGRTYKYEEDRFYDFHLNERDVEPEAPASTPDEDDEETFAGLKGVVSKEDSATIRSAKGTVRGVKNRVRAGIATFLHFPDAKNYKEKEAGKVVLYVTTMGIVRHTFQECLKVKKILRTLLVKYEERDAFMSREVQNELKERMHSEQILVPQLFIEGQHIGDAEIIERLNETGELRKMLKPFKSPDVCNTCQVCGGFRLLPCSICNGSKKSMHRNDFTAEFVALKCMSCDEVGLVKCHAC